MMSTGSKDSLGKVDRNKIQEKYVQIRRKTELCLLCLHACFVIISLFGSQMRSYAAITYIYNFIKIIENFETFSIFVE